MKGLMNFNMKNLLRTKPINEISNQGNELHRVLTAFQLTLFGIGAIIGAGVFVLTGIAAATKAGRASFCPISWLLLPADLVPWPTPSSPPRLADVAVPMGTRTQV
jgi:amino acid permease